MTLADALEIGLRFRHAILLGLGVSLVASLILTPWTIRKLRGAGITGRDMHKADAPEVPEMGGIAVFVAFNVGAFAVLGFGVLPAEEESLILAGLVVAAGACITGILDDLVELRQRFKAVLPFAFAAPLALYVHDQSISFPFVGVVQFGLAYSVLLVPSAIACASNGFNMLEGFNGLGAGLGIVMCVALAGVAIGANQITGLALLLPLLGSLIGFLVFNRPPARVFPGDTMTLLVGAVIAASAILSKVEFWGALLFIPHVVEFSLKAMGRFKDESFASRIEAGRLRYDGRIRSLTHLVMRYMSPSEFQLVASLWTMEIILGGLVVLVFFAT